MLRLTEVKLPLAHTEDDVRAAIVKRLDISPDELTTYVVFKRGLDARNPNAIRYAYTVDVALRDEAAELLAGQGLETEYHWLKSPTVSRLARFIKDKEFRLVVLSEANTLSRKAMLNLLDEIDCPVLLVR